MLESRYLTIKTKKRSKMRKLVVSAWISLDGVFDANSMKEWYDPFDSPSRQKYIRDGILAAEAFIFGRVTYEMLAPYWSKLKNNEMGVAGKLNSAPKYVVSSTLTETTWNNSTIIGKDLTAEIGKLKKDPGKEIQIEGSANLIESLVKAQLVDEFRLLVHPVIMGNGKQFFREGMHAKGFTLTRAESIEKGVVILWYETGMV
jgi:dihydrofolate reductase